MQTSEQTLGQMTGQTKRAKRAAPRSAFKPGVSGNPLGIGLKRVRTQAILDDLVAEFRIRYGQDPSRVEHGDLREIARLRERLDYGRLEPAHRVGLSHEERARTKQYFPVTLADSSGPEVDATKIKRRRKS